MSSYLSYCSKELNVYHAVSNTSPSSYHLSTIVYFKVKTQADILVRLQEGYQYEELPTQKSLSVEHSCSSFYELDDKVVY